MSVMNFGEAINAGLHQAMELDDTVFVFGIGADQTSAIFGTTLGLVERFGATRVLDTPVSEQGMTALVAGAASSGLRPVLVHQRVDFMLYTMDQVVNWIAPWRFASGGRSKMPLTIRAIIGKGWGQGPQHSKSLYSWLAHVPGLQVVVPGSPADAKGLLLSSIMSDDPTIFLEARSLYSMTEDVPEDPYFIRIGTALARRRGRDVTLVTFGSMVPLALEAADRLAGGGISADVVDLRSLMPLDIDTVVESTARTRRLVVTDGDWRMYGVGAEIVASVCEAIGPDLLSRPRRVAWPQSFVPTSQAAEAAFYPQAQDIVAACRASVEGPSDRPIAQGS
jgi:acetoin:2,6-dichlorophenolindophenol oxidoreductase subunit beta